MKMLCYNHLMTCRAQYFFSFSFRVRYHIAASALLFFAIENPLLIGAAQANTHPFDRQEIASDNLSPFVKWTSAMHRTKKQKAGKPYTSRHGVSMAEQECAPIDSLPCALLVWSEFVREHNNKKNNLPELLYQVNTWGNAHPYVVDELNWGMSDFWATPLEFMQVNGDCEDYAIAKYYTLRALGVPADKLRIMIVQDMNLGGIIHAVLAVRDGESLFILDNQIKEVIDAKYVLHYNPIYAVNEQQWWRYVSPQ